MAWTIFLLLTMAWAVVVGTSHTLGGSVHLLLVIALIFFVFNLIQDHRV
jgi:uncharacterized protein DUF5670